MPTTISDADRQKITIESQMMEIASQLYFLAEAIPAWANNSHSPSDSGLYGAENLLTNLARKIDDLSEDVKVLEARQ